MDARWLDAGSRRSLVTPASRSNPGRMHVQGSCPSSNIVATPSATTSSQGGGYPPNSSLLPADFGGAVTSTCPPEAAPCFSPVSGGASERGAPAMAQATTQATARSAICRMPSPAPSIPRSPPIGGQVPIRHVSVPAPSSSPMHSPAPISRGLASERRNIDASLPKGASTAAATAVARAMGAATSPASLATLAGLRQGHNLTEEAMVHDAHVEARFVNIEQRVERRFAELDQRFSNQETALIEVVAKMQQLVFDTDRRFTSLASESIGRFREQVGAMNKSGTLIAFPNADDKLQESKMESSSSTRSQLGSKSDGNQSNTSVDIYGQVRGLQACVDMLQHEIKIDAGQVRRLHARVDLLEADINAINDREKQQVLSGGAVERQSADQVRSVPAVHIVDETSSDAHSKTSTIPLREIFQRLTSLENEQRNLTDDMWRLREVVGSSHWKNLHPISHERTEDPLTRAGNLATVR